jgi:hypothetical protein
VLGKEKSIGDGGGAGVSPISVLERVEMMFEALKAALTSWPSVELVRMERRWRGVTALGWWTGILMEEEVVVVVIDELVEVEILNVVRAVTAGMEWSFGMVKAWKLWRERLYRGAGVELITP